MILQIIISVLCIYILIPILRRRKLASILQRKFKCPKGYPLIGHSLEFLNAEEALEKNSILHKEFGKSIYIQLGSVFYVDTIDPKLAEFISSNSFFNTKSIDYVFFHKWFGTGLLTSSGEKWHSHRKILTPSFHYTILEEFVKVFNSATDVLIEKLNTIGPNEDVDIYKFITLLTLDIIHETAMGTSIDAQLKPNSDYINAIRDMCSIVHYRTFSPIGRFDALYFFSSIRRKEIKALKIIHKHSNEIIRRRRQIVEKPCDTTNEKNMDETGAKKKYTFLDVLLKNSINGSYLSNEEIREEVDTFMFEGHDTTAAAISFIIYCIATHQDVQDRIFEELQTIFGKDKDRPASIHDLKNMKYLEMVIKEGLRLYPSVPSYARMLLEDVEYDGAILPKGVMFSITSITMHRDPDLYPDPLKFDPERFTLENQAKRHPFAYLPFSAGFRNCIGQKFAMLEMTSTISKMLRHFELVPIPSHNLKIASQVTLYSYTGIKIRLQKRNTRN